MLMTVHQEGGALSCWYGQAAWHHRQAGSSRRCMDHAGLKPASAHHSACCNAREACQLLVDTLSLLGWDAFPSLG